MRSTKRICRLLLSLFLFSVGIPYYCAAQNSDDNDSQAVAGASSGSSPGSAGMEERESAFLSELKRAERSGRRSQAYIGSLLRLGMYYNRQNQFSKATGSLSQALSLIDSGALHPTPAKDIRPERVIEKAGPGGTVSATVVRTPMPYEEVLQDLLPQLVTAEIGCNLLASAEKHIKRLIALQGTNPVTAKLNLMTAYTQYAELLHKQHRDKEARVYEKKAQEINSSFKPL
ncbi:MAG TPA: hypothetical protein V6C72_08325 [Chroococcales cyanobacterium]